MAGRSFRRKSAARSVTRAIADSKPASSPAKECSNRLLQAQFDAFSLPQRQDQLIELLTQLLRIRVDVRGGQLDDRIAVAGSIRDRRVELRQRHLARHALRTDRADAAIVALEAARNP